MLSNGNGTASVNMRDFDALPVEHRRVLCYALQKYNAGKFRKQIEEQWAGFETPEDFANTIATKDRQRHEADTKRPEGDLRKVCPQPIIAGKITPQRAALT